MRKGPKEFMREDNKLTSLMQLLDSSMEGYRPPTPEGLITIMRQIDKCETLAERHNVYDASMQNRHRQTMRDLRGICLEMLEYTVKETRIQQRFDAAVVESSRMLVEDLEKQGKFFSSLEPVLEELGHLSKAGRKMVNAQTQRRSEWQAQRRVEWQAWQTWIDETMEAMKWGFKFTQHKAADHFKYSLKTIQRRTKKPGQAD